MGRKKDMPVGKPGRADRNAPSAGTTAGLPHAIRAMADLPGLLFSNIRMDGSAGLDGRVNAALARVGELVAVSRVYVMLDEEDGRLLRNTHEWVSAGAGPAMASWPLHSYQKDIPSLKPLMEGKPFFAAHTRDLPPDMRHVLAMQAVDSALLVPLTRDGAWIGLVGFDSCGAEREWRAEEVDILRLLAGLIAEALERGEYLAVRERLDRVRAALGEAAPPSASRTARAADSADGPSLIEAERQLLVETLARHGGNRGAAARQLGIAWASLDRRCKKLGIKVRKE